MSAPEPVEYQAKAIEKIADALVALASVDQSKDRLVVLKAPTGSGKTLMVASALADAYDNPAGRQFIVLWLTPGKGDLHKQSARALDYLLAGRSLQVRLLDDQDDIVKHQDPAPGSVFVVNWEKLRMEKDGKWANKMLADGENATLFTLLAAASAKGLDMIAVIDESHLSLQAPRTSKLMAAINEKRPFIQLELSATPTTQLDQDLVADGVQHYIRVKFEDVEAEGMVRKSVLLNEDLSAVITAHAKESIQVQVLWAAWEKVQALTAAYTTAGSPVRPLLLIQYPDGEKAEQLAGIVEAFLTARGLVKDKTFATWLSGDHSDDLEKIASNSSPYRALIFKQAIATGWDCPRAQVLVQFRDPKSPIFQIQTLGRILRSPEQKHYDDESLNVAYVFSDLEGVKVSIETDEPDAKVRDMTIKRSSDYPSQGLMLHSTFQPRTREFHYPMTGNLTKPLNAALDAKVAPLLTADPYTATQASVLADAVVTTKQLDAGSGHEMKGDTATGDLDDVIVQALYNQLLVQRIGAYRSRAQSLSRIKKGIAAWFKTKRPAWTADEIQHFALRHQEEFMAAVDEACHASRAVEEAAAIATARGKRRTTTEWEVPVAELVASKDCEAAGAGFLFEPALVPISRSAPEKRFEAYLAKQVASGVVQWWWKNGEQDEKFLGVVYDRPVVNGPGAAKGKGAAAPTTEEHIAYPDYLVSCVDGTVWAIEVKDVDDKDGATDGVTNAKARGLAKWALAMASLRPSQENLIGLAKVRAGIVVPTELAPGVITVKIGDPEAWQPPTASNLASDAGWSSLDLTSGVSIETDEN